MLRDDIEQYTKLTGDDGWNAPIIKVGAYLDGYNKGLEVFDKIRAKIEKLQKMCDKNDLNLMSQYSAFGMVLDIIDEYIAESEDQE